MRSELDAHIKSVYFNPNNSAAVITHLLQKVENQKTEISQMRESLPVGYMGISNNEGEKHGLGVMKDVAGNIHCGQWRNDVKHGHGIFTRADGTKHEGEFKNGYLQGVGNTQWSNGTWRCGFGIETLACGDSYEGIWNVRNDLVGVGKYTFEDGDVYDGEFRDLFFHGQGKMTYTNGDIYEGQWANDDCNGLGKMTYNDGSVYEGQWKDDKRTGDGKHIFENKSVYTGKFKDGKMHGTGCMTDVAGNKLTGEWIEGVITKGKIAFVNGDVFEGDVFEELGEFHTNGKGTITREVVMGPPGIILCLIVDPFNPAFSFYHPENKKRKVDDSSA